MRLGEALRRAGVLSGLGAPGWLGALLDAVEIDLPDLPDPLVDVVVPVVLDRGPLQLAASVRVTGTSTSARLAVTLADLRLAWDAGTGAGAVTLAGSPGELVVAVAGDGRLTTTLTSPDGAALVALTVSDPDGGGVVVAGTGGVGLVLHPSAARLLLADGEPVVEVDGRLALAGLEVAGSATEVEVRGLRWSRHGLAGRVAGTAAGGAWEVGWDGGHDLVPATLLVDLPLASVPGLAALPAVEPGCRLRVTGGRGRSASGPQLELAAEVLGGPRGIVATDRPDVTAAALLLTATAGSAVGADGTTVVAAALVVAGVVVGPLAAHGSARVTRARVDLATPRRASFDYESALDARLSVAGALDLGTTAPMRAAVRGVVLDWTGVPTLDWRVATIDVADPGQWKVFAPDRLLQVERTRSGTGSAWFEVDLRFVLDAGPVSLDGATVRVTLPTEPGGGAPSITVRGLGARLEVPGLVKARGSVSLGGGSLHAELAATLPPLNLNAAASVDLGPGGSLLASLDVDLPAPVPIASTGIGLFGVGGVIGLDRALALPPDLDGRLRWDPATGNVVRDGSSLLGFRVAVGTLPDLGHAFSAVGKLAVSTPDLAVIAAVSGRLLGGRPTLVDPPADGSGLRGVLAITPEEIALGVVARYRFPDDKPVLLDAVAPVEARWPRRDPGWFVRLGTDRSRAPGPIRAEVLPDLLPVDVLSAEAFLMVEGNGLQPFPVAAAPSGLVVAAGFEFRTTIVCFPAVAEIWAGAVVAVSTRPVFLSGEARLGGRLRLGPFALGVDATMGFQVGPGNTFAAALHICGEIDLWLFEISGCVTIALGKKQQPDLAPPVSPLVSGSVVDHGGSVVLPGPDGVAVCWPDATLQVGYAPAPAGTPAGSFTVAKAAFDRSGGVGDDDRYHARYELLRLDLVSPAGAPQPPAGLAGTWQTKPAQDAVPGDGAATLALLTRDPALWTGRLADGGRHDVSDPIGSKGRECRGEHVDPRTGWALGAHALRRPGGGWTLPPLPPEPPAPPSGLQSQVAVRAVETVWPTIPELDADGEHGEVAAGPGGRAWLPPGVTGVLGRVVEHPVRADDYYSPTPEAGRRAVLLLPDVVYQTWAESPRSARTTLRFTEPLDRGLLVLLTGTELEEGSVTSPEVEWSRVAEGVQDGGEHVSVWESGSGWTLGEVTVVHPQRYSVDEAGDPDDGSRLRGVAVVGLEGVSVAARDLAERLSNTKIHTAPSPVPPTTAPPTGTPAAPVVGPLAPFVPDHTYELRHQWRADHGVGPQSVPHAPPPETALRFRVAPRVEWPPAPQDLLSAVHVFHPAMLARHLRGYRPAGAGSASAAPWFTDDAVSAYLDRTGVAVAHAYGLTPTIRVTATDAAPGEPVPFTEVTIQPADDPAFLTDVEAATLAGMTLPCALPHGPVRLMGSVPLKPRRSYDIGLDFTGGGFRYAPGTTRLPPTAFTTSRWSGPDAMLAEAGFGTSLFVAARSPARVCVEARPAVTGDESSDGALLAALRGAVVPELDQPVRTTLLIDPDSPGSRLAGVLLEAREPLLRPVTMAGLTLDTARAPGGGLVAAPATWARVADRAGTRVLFVPRGSADAGVPRLSWTAWGRPWSATLNEPALGGDALPVLVALAGGAS